MKKIPFANFSEKATKALMKISSYKKYEVETPLYYQGQTPIVAYFILHGNILLVKNKQIHYRLTKGHILGYYELLFNHPSPYTAKILSNTEIIYIDKSTLFEIMNSKRDEICQLRDELKNITPII